MAHPYEEDGTEDLAERPAKKTPGPKKAEKGDNIRANDAYAVTADELRSFVERLEQLEAEKADIGEQVKEVFAEAKGRGYDTKVMRMVLKLRKKKPDERAEEEAVLQVYLAALGME